MSNWQKKIAELFPDVVVNVKDFGARGDGVTDDTLAIQNAINSADGQIVFFPKGTYIVSDTLLINQNANVLRGENSNGSIIEATSALAGKPILNVSNTFMNEISHLQFKYGTSSTNQPSVAIQIEQSVTGGYPTMNSFRNLYLVGYFEYGIKIVSSIGWEDNNYFENIKINNCSGAGVYVSNFQQMSNDFNHIMIGYCGIGLQTKAKHTKIDNAFFYHNDKDINLLSGSSLYATNISSENSAQFIVGYNCVVNVNGGYFYPGGSIIASRKIVEGTGFSIYSFKNYLFKTSSNAISDLPLFSFTTVGDGFERPQVVIFKHCWNVSSNQLIFVAHTRNKPIAVMKNNVMGNIDDGSIAWTQIGDVQNREVSGTSIDDEILEVQKIRANSLIGPSFRGSFPQESSVKAGTLPAGTYYYAITAMIGSSETTIGSEGSVSKASDTTSIKIEFNNIRGATKYRIYRGTSSGVYDGYYEVFVGAGAGYFYDVGDPLDGTTTPPAENGLIGTVETDQVGIGTSDYGSGEKVVAIGNAVIVPSSNPAGGGVLYVEGGVLKYRGSSGTVTTIAPA